MQLLWLKVKINALVLQLPHKVSTVAQFLYLKYQGIDSATNQIPCVMYTCVLDCLRIWAMGCVSCNGHGPGECVRCCGCDHIYEPV